MQPQEIIEEQFNAEELSTLRLGLILSLSSPDVVDGYLPKSEESMKRLFSKLDALTHAADSTRHCSTRRQNEKVNYT